MTTPPSHAEALEAERAVNERYLSELRRSEERLNGVRLSATTSRNQQWGGTGPIPGRPTLPSDAISGRVGLGTADPHLRRGFYVGSYPEEWDSVLVVSWAAPVASLFYEGRSSSDIAAPLVVATRTFVAEGSDLVDFAEERHGSASSTDPFDADSSKLVVPRAPRVVRRRPSMPSAVAPPAHPPVAAALGAEPPRKPSVRAEEAVQKLLERPRTGRLASLLATLQPDQYRLVTWPDNVPLIVQGHPGTGKTVIAAHRAAFLTNPDREDPRPLDRVLLLGPTDRYVDHVSPVLRELHQGGSVDVRSIGGLMLRAGNPGGRPEPEYDERLDSVWDLGRLAESAVNRLRLDGLVVSNDRDGVRKVVEHLLRPPPALQAILANHGELAPWIASIGSWQRAAGSSRYGPFLATIGLALHPPTTTQRYDHIVVDEAQDLRPLEWRLVNAYRRPGASLTLVGDRHQRRSDWSPSSWARLAQDLELTDDAGNVAVEPLTAGYRSTRQILAFANQLLPRGERAVVSLRDGSAPTVEPHREGVLLDSAFRAASALAEEHVPGLIAVITVGPKAMSDRFRHGRWLRSAEKDAWTKEGQTVVVLHPDQARGLEFDGVVVVEPAAFPQNLGRHGTLYTSLTRATQSLIVVHSKPLPRDLRRGR